MLPRATTSPRGRAETSANAARAWSVKLLHKAQNEEGTAKARERRGRLDKLRVTGSSPVPPTELGVAQTAGVTAPGSITPMLVFDCPVAGRVELDEGDDVLDLKQVDLRSVAEALEDHSDMNEWWLDPMTGQVEPWLADPVFADADIEDHPAERDWVLLEAISSRRSEERRVGKECRL